MQLLISHIKTQTEVDGVILCGSQIEIPESLQTDTVGLAHEGHQYAEKTLQLLRQTCWFSGIRKQVLSYVESCLPSKQTYSLTGLGKGCMQILRALSTESITYMSFFINTATILKLIWLLLRVLRSLSLSWTVFLPLVAIQRQSLQIMALHTLVMKWRSMQRKGVRLTAVTPDDPRCNGFIENFVKLICKLLHTEASESKDSKIKLYNCVLHYRATPHSTTGRSPAELLLNRKRQTKLPQIFTVKECDDLKDMRECHNEKRLQQKKYFDIHKRAKPNDIAVGDEVLVQQNKTALKALSDPSPYTID